MKFLKNILNSIYSPSFYAGIPQKSFGSALGYFLLLVFILIIAKMAILAPTLLFDIPKNIKTLADSVVNAYPAELEVKIQNGQVTTNVEEPYFIALPKGEGNQSNTITNFVVIDTKTPFSAAAFNNYQTIAWLSKDTLFTKSDRNGEIKTLDLTKFPNYTINKNSLVSLENSFSPWLKFVGPVALIGSLLGLYLVYSGRLIYLLVLALIIWLIAKIFKRALTYGQSYKIGLYAMTLALLIDLGISFLPWKGFSFMFTIITLGVIIANMFLVKPNSSK